MARQRVRVQSNNNFLIGVIVIAIYAAIFWLLNRLSLRIGEDAVYYVLGKNILQFIICAFPIVLYFIKESKKKTVIKRGKDYNPAAELEQLYEENENAIKKEWERQLRSPRREKGLPIPMTLGTWAIIAAVFLVFAIGGLVNSIRDLSGGMRTIILQETQVTYRNNSETGGYANVKIRGIRKSIIYDFPVNELNTETIRLINLQHPYIVVTYYPNTEAVVQFDIYATEGIISVPSGSVPRQNNLSESAIETLTAAQAKEPYEDVSLATLNLERYETISNKTLDEVWDDIAPMYSYMVGSGGFASEQPTEENYQTYVSIVDELKLECDLDSNQDCRILFKDDVAIVIVYNFRNNMVEDMFAVRCIFLQ